MHSAPHSPKLATWFAFPLPVHHLCQDRHPLSLLQHSIVLEEIIHNTRISHTIWNRRENSQTRWKPNHEPNQPRTTSSTGATPGDGHCCCVHVCGKPISGQALGNPGWWVMLLCFANVLPRSGLVQLPGYLSRWASVLPEFGCSVHHHWKLSFGVCLVFH